MRSHKCPEAIYYPGKGWMGVTCPVCWPEPAPLADDTSVDMLTGQLTVAVPGEQLELC